MRLVGSRLDRALQAIVKGENSILRAMGHYGWLLCTEMGEELGWNLTQEQAEVRQD